MPFISIIIPTWRKSIILQRCLNSLLSQNYPKNKFEIILISKNKLRFKNKHIKTIKIKSHLNHAQARNIGVKSAKGQILAFCDDDCILPKNWLATAAPYFTKNKADLISGPILPPKKAPFLQRLSGYLSGSRFTIGFAAPRYRQLFPEKEASEFDLILANTFIKKSVFKKFNGFHDHQVPCEENFLYARLKKNHHQLLYVPSIACIHPSKSVIFPWASKIFFYATGRGSMLCRAPETIHPQYFIPSFFVITLIALPFLALFSPLASSLLTLFLATYLFFNLLNAAHIFFKFEPNPLIFILAPLTTFILHISYGLGFLYGSLRYLLGQTQASKMPSVDK